ncbi:MAG: hypothetical protein RR314_02800 [Oscillospiraceae bacterium]
MSNNSAKTKSEPKKKERFWEQFRRSAREDPPVFWTYLILRFFVLVALTRSIMRGDIEGAFTCVIVLLIYLLPHLIERKLDIDIPSALEIIIFVFVFCAEILGELQSYFVLYPHWDTVLHTSSGFLFAAMGFALVDLLNRSERVKIELTPFYVALMAFCFSMTVGVLWEFIEFCMDRIFLLDMQKDTVINLISSVALDETRSNIPIVLDGISDVVVNGRSLGLGGYLDIGLYDTMEDLFVNLIGATVFSVIGFFEARSAKPFLMKHLLPRRRKIIADDVETKENK